MLSKSLLLYTFAARNLFRPLRRSLSTTSRNAFKVTICGAASPLGQALSLRVKTNPLVSELALYDTVDTKGIAADLSHIDYWSMTHGFVGPKDLFEALYCAAVVIICAGETRRAGMQREDLFQTNAKIVEELVTAVPRSSPRALIGILTNPINSCVPMAAEALKKINKYCPKRLFGIPTIDVVRARTFIAQEMPKVDPHQVDIPVIGGHSGLTIIPLISQCRPKFDSDLETLKRITNRIQDAGSEVLLAKEGKGAATLSVAYAASRAVHQCLRALKGDMNVVECLYVESKITDAPFFASPVILTKDGIGHIEELPRLNELEHELLQNAVPILKLHAEKGVKFVQGMQWLSPKAKEKQN